MTKWRDKTIDDKLRWLRRWLIVIYVATGFTAFVDFINKILALL